MVRFHIVFLFLIFCDNGKNDFVKYNQDYSNCVRINDSIFNLRHGLMYEQKIPFSGCLAEYFENGLMQESVFFLNGQRHGWSMRWHRNGILEFEKFFLFGLKQKFHKKWYDNGSIKFIHRFKDDLFEGEQLDYFKNGNIASKRNYLNGFEEGQQMAWNFNGKLLQNYHVKNKKRYGIIGRKDCISVFEED